MRRLAIFEHVSLDGIIQIGGPGGDADFPPGEWTAPYRTPAGRAYVLAAYGERFDLLVGRRTYDRWADFWPQAPAGPLTDRFNAATKYVATHRPGDLTWGPSAAVGPDLAADVRRLKEGEGPAIIVAGSSTLVSPLLDAGLVDALLLFVYPVLLGGGKRIAANVAVPQAFRLAETRALPSGIVVSRYETSDG